jgi:hypothetical protein
MKQPAIPKQQRSSFDGYGTAKGAKSGIQFKPATMFNGMAWIRFYKTRERAIL